MPMDEMAECLTDANHVVVPQVRGGAAESGIPTIRDALTGLWERFDPLRLTTPEAYLAALSLCRGLSRHDGSSLKTDATGRVKGSQAYQDEAVMDQHEHLLR